jgi:hypothetical protein
VSEPFTVRQLRPDTEQRCFALVGPDGRVWHESWTESLLVKLAAKYNEIYAMGYEARRTAEIIRDSVLEAG